MYWFAEFGLIFDVYHNNRCSSIPWISAVS